MGAKREQNMSKADYVRSQAGLGHDGKHKCHADGCSKPIAPAYLMCPAHWRMVPAEIQRRIWLLYRPGQEVDKRPTGQYLSAMKDAIAAVAKAEEDQRQKSLPFGAP